MIAERIDNLTQEHQKELQKSHPDSRFRSAAIFVIKHALKIWNGLDIDVTKLPQTGPAIFVCNHTSMYDGLVGMVADPYSPPTAFPVKKELFRFSVVSSLLKSSGALAVDRDGRDVGSLRQIINLVEKEGRTVGIAIEGTRSRDGRLQPFDPVAVELVVRMARRGVPVYPLGIIGTDQALPKGAIFPGRHRIQLIAGDKIDLSEFINQKGKISQSDKELAAARIRTGLISVLPPRYHPVDDCLMRKK
ncbi:1-acyl-sn-glycerol-3-phosphate acyltransferase [Candidatus Daviesbacteria bacterium]|nr:1-acyl-sn-glycerol-3-phosphate acyltransferase [Candidatus Daviesbacteria bacterium]